MRYVSGLEEDWRTHSYSQALTCYFYICYSCCTTCHICCRFISSFGFQPLCQVMWVCSMCSSQRKTWNGSCALVPILLIRLSWNPRSSPGIVYNTSHPAEGVPKALTYAHFFVFILNVHHTTDDCNHKVKNI